MKRKQKKSSQSPSFRQWFNKKVPRPAFEEANATELWAARRIFEHLGDEKYFQEQWNQLAGRYSQIYHAPRIGPAYTHHFQRTAAYVLSKSRFKGNEHILSICSGVGLLESFIAHHRVPQGKVTVVDYAHQMNKEAQKWEPTAKNFHAITGNARQLPIRANSQDIVLFLGGANPQGTFQETIFRQAHQAIRKNAHARFIVANIVRHPQDIAWSIHDLQQAGFKIIHDQLEPLANGAVFSLFLTATPILDSRTKKGK